MEYFDVYNDKKEKTGAVLPRKGTILKEGEYMLYTLAIIERPDGKILITQRSMDKKWAAGAWEVSGGGVLSGESSFDGVCREVREEVGLDVSSAQGKCIYTYSNVDLERGDNYFVDIYHFIMDFTEADICIQQSEAIAFDIVPFEKITELDSQENFLHYKRIVEALEAEKAM